MLECGPLAFWVTFAAVIVGCIVTRQMYKQSLTSDEKRILDSWRYSMKRPNSEFSNILVGIHCNVDLVISGTKFFSKLNIKPGRVANHDLLNTTNDFKETFSYYFLRGVPAERFVTDRQVFQTIVKAAESEGGVEYMIGGSAAIIANEISQLYPTADLYLIGAIGPLLKQLLHWNITHLKKMEKDELHLIIEYPEQHIWGHLVAPRASRFIVSHETFSVSDALLDMFFKAAVSRRAELIIFAGIHLFQFQPKPLWAENLRQINSRIKQISRSSAIHLEVSCILDDDFGRNMLYRIIPFVDSIGLNDQELLVLANVGDGPFANTSQGDILEPHKTVKIIKWLLTKFSYMDYTEEGRTFRLKRIHVHANGYHILAVSGDSWTNNRAALSAGARLGGKRACGEMIGHLETDMVELRLEKRHFLLDQDIDEFYTLNFRQPVHDWSTVFRPKGHSEWSEIYFFFTPLLMCRKPRNTASLGDVITSSALMFSEFRGFET